MPVHIPVAAAAKTASKGASTAARGTAKTAGQTGKVATRAALRVAKRGGAKASKTAGKAAGNQASKAGGRQGAHALKNAGKGATKPTGKGAARQTAKAAQNRAAGAKSPEAGPAPGGRKSGPRGAKLGRRARRAVTSRVRQTGSNLAHESTRLGTGAAGTGSGTARRSSGTVARLGREVTNPDQKDAHAVSDIDQLAKAFSGKGLGLFVMLLRSAAAATRTTFRWLRRILMVPLGGVLAIFLVVIIIYGALGAIGIVLMEEDQKEADEEAALAAELAAQDETSASGEGLGEVGGIPYADTFNETAELGIDPRLVAAVAKQESGFSPDVITCERYSSAGARGIMQIMPFHNVDACDPLKAIPWGARYLLAQYRTFGEWECAIAAYNAGPGNVQTALNNSGGSRCVPRITETQNYVKAVTAFWEDYKEQFPDSVISAGGSGVAGDYSLPIPKSIYESDGRKLVGGEPDPTKKTGDWFAKPHHDYAAADIPVPTGTEIYAVASGKVSKAVELTTSYGTHVFIEGDDGAAYIYGHGRSGSLQVEQGQRVEAGDLLMYSGNTGNSKGAHLHFEMRIDGQNRCPQKLLLSIYDGEPVAPATLPSTGCFYPD